MKKKIILTIAFILRLSPMLLNQYGGAKGIQEISGLCNLFNPIGIIAALLFIIGAWIPFKNIRVSKVLSILGLVGIVITEIYQFLTWHIQTITGNMSMQNSFNFAILEFYIGLTVSLIMIIAYFLIDKFVKE